MPPTVSSDVRITDIVYDFLIVEVLNPCLQHHSFFYTIINANNQVVRKGSFSGIWVQLRLTHINEGNYQLYLKDNEDYNCVFSFKKSTPSFEKLSLIMH